MRAYILSVSILLMSIASFGADTSSYLYWMVGTEANSYEYGAVKIHAIANTGASTGDYYLDLYAGNGTLIGEGDAGVAEKYITSSQSANQGYYALLSAADYKNYTYVIELFNDSAFVAQSFPDLTSATIDAYVATTQSSTGIQELVTAWKPTTYAVPEPNSALLLLLGCAGLALRRRRLMHA